MLNRRQFLWWGCAAAAGLCAAADSRIKLGILDSSLRLSAKIEAVALAASLGLEGLEIGCGRPAGGEPMPLADPGLQERYLEELRKYRIAAAGVTLGVLHSSPLKSDPAAPKWVAQGIEIAARMRAGGLLLPFFNKAALETLEERNHVADLLKDLGREAARAGVVLGLEGTLSAEDNARLLDRAGSSAVKVYYDVGNTTTYGFDAPREIRWLGRDRIYQVHVKDKGYLGEGKVDVVEVIRALREIGYRGWVNLETPAPSGDVEGDGRRNVAYLRKVLASG
jgi:L-ribulose-5-phosphate 3-epimerase